MASTRTPVALVLADDRSEQESHGASRVMVLMAELRAAGFLAHRVATVAEGLALAPTLVPELLPIDGARVGRDHAVVASLVAAAWSISSTHSALRVQLRRKGTGADAPQ